jgi:hypothetical protein
MNLEEKFLNSAAAALPTGELDEGDPNFRGPVPPAAQLEAPTGEIVLTPDSPEAAARIAAGRSTPASIIGQEVPAAKPAPATGAMPTAGRVFPEDTASIQSIPRNDLQEFMGNIGSAIQSGAEYLDFAVIGLPDVGTLTLKDLTVGDLGKVMEAMSYGFTPTTGEGQTLRPTPEALDLLNAIPAFQAASKAVKYGAKGLKAGAEALAPAAADVIESGLRKTGMIADIVPFTAKGKLSDITNTITELSTAGVEPKTMMDAEKALSNGDRVFAFAEMDEMPMLIRNVGDLKAYTPDQLLVLPAKQQAQTAIQVAGAATEISTAGAKTSAEAITQSITKSSKTKKPKAGEFDMSVFNEPIAVQPSVNTLSKSFDNALSSYLALPQDQQVIKTKEANAALSKWLGVGRDGKTKSLLGTNQKLEKTEKGYKGAEPILLPDGRGVETTGLALSPAYKEGKFTTCPNSASCAKECLGKTSSGYFFGGGGKDLSKMIGTRLHGFKKTQAFFRDPENFAIKLHNEITAKKFLAAQNGNHLAIRLNVLSDINPRVHEQLIKAHPDVTFYDYTKNNTNPIAPNHHYTYSSTGVSQNVNGVEVVNSNQNWKQMRRRLDEGKNVAMAFSHKQLIPQTLLDEETGKIYKVISGDTHDFRPIDAVPDGTDGVIIGLKNKAAPRSASGAAKESDGFFVHYDPEIPKAKGKLARDESGNLMIQNTQVKIAKQGTGQITMTNDYTPMKEAK